MTTLFQQLNSGVPYILQFAGQAAPWKEELAQLREDPILSAELIQLDQQATQILAPVLPEITQITGGKLQLLEPNVANAAFASVPGIFLCQYAALRELGLSAKPLAVLGYSQGVLAVELLKNAAGEVQMDGCSEIKAAQILALARLIGAAATRVTRKIDAAPRGQATSMLAVRGVPNTQIAELATESGVTVAIVNSASRATLSGNPQSLIKAAQKIAQLADWQNKALEEKTAGVQALTPSCEFLPVDAPFHSPLLDPAVALVAAWVQDCDFGELNVMNLARKVLTEHVDWCAEITQALSLKPEWIVDLGPGTSLRTITSALTAGHGLGIAEAGDAHGRDLLQLPGAKFAKSVNYAQFAPSIAMLNGKKVLQTKFTTLTGRAPVLLAGMTPTTVEAEIVAAAANAGYWVEMAGGGQVTEEVFLSNLADLKKQLNPGQTAQFNAMFMDRYLWNLQFGTQHIVSRERRNGAPIDGLVISAGIPEVDEANELIAQLREAGFPYLAFKPGTVDQIRQVLEIAKANSEIPIILMVEDGHAGGHHSWEDLAHLLLGTYAQIRSQKNTVLCVGGGLGDPARAAQFLTGEWALSYVNTVMPVDGIFIGTTAMTAKEAHTTDAVKELLVRTPGISFAQNNGWVGSGEVSGGMTSGISHLHADMYEIDNAAARASRLLVKANDAQFRHNHRDEIIAAINATAKPYFGELEQMTYAQVLQRYAELTYPDADLSWVKRFHELLQRCEARLCDRDAGEISTLFPDLKQAENPFECIEQLLAVYPNAASITFTVFDAAWFIELCRKYPKPVPFVPAIDESLMKWWGTDGLWQSHDPRYDADQVRIIPGPVSVAAIETVNEPIADILARYERAAIQAVESAADGAVVVDSQQVPQIFARIAADFDEYVRRVPHIVWHGHLITNPAHVLDRYQIEVTEVGYDIVVDLDTLWSDSSASHHSVKLLRIPLILNDVENGALPVVDDLRLPAVMHEMLCATAGVGAKNVMGDDIPQLPKIQPSNLSEFGEARYTFQINDELGALHAGVTASTLSAQLHLAEIVPAALLGLCWPAIYAALGSAEVNNFPVIEGLFNAVHLDHSETLNVMQIPQTATIEATSYCAQIAESASGRIVTVETILRFKNQERSVGDLVNPDTDREIGRFSERFAIRGRAEGALLPAEPWLGAQIESQMRSGKRALLRKVQVAAPQDMTAFAMVSGDYNPIHTSSRAAKIAGLDAPLVHGMWLCAAAQHTVSAEDENGMSWNIESWLYRMYGLVALSDQIDISVERIGTATGGRVVLEVISKVAGEIVSQATAIASPKRTAYVFPGQGIQKAGMALDERIDSAAARDIWERADAYTRKELDFSILAIVRDNPTTLVAKGITYRHPQGVLNLTQFTQVALAAVAFAQTARLEEAGALVDGAYFAGHSLGEYTALSAYGKMMSLETVLGIVFQRGSTMHHLVPRDETGNSEYKMGALRPNQFGVTDADVAAYVAQVSRESGEFLEIVNYNLAGAQYAVAGTNAGIAALAQDATARATAAGGKTPFMLIPGVDVPFHSTRLRDGVEDFAAVLAQRLPHEIDFARLENRYIPNLVARPFAFTKEFCSSILDVVPSAYVQDLQLRWETIDWDTERGEIGRNLLVELLSWQFASPVRWIETQDFLFSQSRIEEFVEIGLGHAPTLANLAVKTLQLPKFANKKVKVLNVQRDSAIVYRADEPTVFATSNSKTTDFADRESKNAAVENTVAELPEVDLPNLGDTNLARMADPNAASAALIATPAAPEALSAGAKNPEINFDAADALKVLLAYSTKIDLAQISAQDTIEILTNGVSSKRNQLLMDISAELGLSALEGGAEASIAELTKNICVAAHNYTPFGPVLSEIIAEHIRRLFGAAGASLSDIAKHVSTQWQLGAGWQSWVTAFVLLQTREGKSTRGGELAALPIPASMPEVFALIDQAVINVGKFLAVTVAKPSANNAKGAGGAMVDAAALDEFKNFITGSLAENARDLLTRLGQTAIVENSGATDNELIETVTAELGASWTKLVANVFDSRKAVELNDRWATAREDVTRIALGVQISANFAATGAEVARQAVYLSEQTSDTEIKTRLLEIAQQAVDFSPGEFSGQIAVVTGMTPQSIAGAVTAKLLAGGATVIATASHISQQRLVDIRNLYRQSARGDAALWLVPANLGSYRDIDALIDWIGTEQTENIGGTTHLVKPALNPDLLFPFAAPRVMGTMEEAGPRAENEMRIMLWGVERLITGLGILGGEHHISHRLHTILPGSPNRGRFGGDGAYGEVKSALDAICNKWRVEPWGKHVTLAHARIGWVRGTGLMGGNDPLIAAVEAKGVRTWTTSEIAEKLIEISTAEARKRALDAPIDADFTGGLDEIDFTELTAQAGEHEAQVQTSAELVPDQMIQALPSPKQMKLAQGAELFPQGSAKPAEMIVIVGIGEVGTWGSARTRFAAELGIQDDGKVELTAAGVLELAWMMGLLTWHESPQAGWYDTADNLVEEQDIYSRFRDEVVARSGIRRLTDEESIHDAATTDMVTVFLDHPISFTVSSEAEARAYFNADPQFTQISRASDDHKLWKVTRLKGATTLVPRRTTLSRFIAGQFPQGFDPQKWGIPAAMLESADKMAAWNLVATVDAFISAGFSPAELLQVVHPSSVGCTQGTGFGGMSSMRKLFVERFLNESVPQDILQETLPNVIAAHTMQAYVGGYGAMVQPVAACATAAVSLEEGVDKIATGKASFVVTGGIDDLSVESLEGFGFMNATADSQSLVDRGIHERFCSRAGDSRRDGFVEAQGGGTVLIARGDLALEMGLPVYGVVGYVQSFADGMHTSIPAPGIGALAAGQGGKESRLACALAELGVSSDDIAIVSKHDTSTKANDPNEAELHHLLAQALGRTPGNPLYVISQKTLTGHAKGGAALFQIAGMTQVFATGMIPANRSLDNLDPEFAVRDYLVWLRDPLNYGEHLPIKAGLITSLGFGHVSSVIALVHPGAFEAAIMRTHGTAALQQWREAALSRLHAGAQHLSQAMIGREALYQPQTGRRLPDVAHEAEISMLLDLDARLGTDGKYGE